MSFFDTLLGDTPDRQAQFGLLMQGLSQRNGVGGLLAGNQYAQQAPDRRRQAEMQQMQMENMRAEIDERKAKVAAGLLAQQNDDAFFGRGQPGMSPGMSPGAFRPSPVDGMGPTMPQDAAPQSGGGFTAQQISQQFGIPIESLFADKRFNGGKKIAELINDRSKPAWQNINGSLVNTNAPGFQGGFVPDPTKGMNFEGGRISTIPGFNEFTTANTFASEAPKALFNSAGKVNLRDNSDGTKSPVSEFAENPTLQGLLGRMYGPQGVPQSAPQAQPMPQSQPRPQPMPQRAPIAPLQVEPAPTGNFKGDPAQIMEAITQIRDPQERAGAMAAFQEQSRRAGGFAQGAPGIGYGKTTAQTQAEEVSKTKAVKDAENAAARDATMAKGAVNSADTLNYINEARALFAKGPTNSGLGSAIDSTANFFGKSTAGADAAAQLKTLSGWMVSNVPRMEGPQSNYDVENYKTMAGMMGDDTKPLPQRMAALDTLERLQKKYAHLSGGESPKAEAPPAAKVIDALPKMAPKGQRVRDTTTGKILKFNGMSWVEEK